MAKNRTEQQCPALEPGVYAAALTPLHPDLTCHFEELADHCQDLIHRGCNGVVLFGTTGEGPSFSLDERLQAYEKIIERGVDPQKIILANGGSNIPETVELTKAYLKCNSPAILITPPSFFKHVSEEGVIAFYREIIQKVNDPNLRIILYHIPQFSGVPITLGIIAVLRQEFPEIVVGLKESEGNLAWMKRIIAAHPGFKVFVGNEKQIIEAVHCGAAGSICGIANLYPELICSLYFQGKQNSQENPTQLNDFFEAMKGYHFISVFKAWMEKSKGEAWHCIRPPLLPLNTEQKNAFISKLERKISQSRGSPGF